MRQEVSVLVIKTGSSVESFGEFENKQTNASALAPTPRILNQLRSGLGPNPDYFLKAPTGILLYNSS